MHLERQPEMTMRQDATIVGVFDELPVAKQAIGELSMAGFREEQIGFAMRHDEAAVDETAAGADADVESGAITGALTGLGLGALAGLGVLAGVIPVIGPAIAAGTLGVMLSNAAAGAAVVGLVGALVSAGVPEEEADYYRDEFEAGRILITVAAGNRMNEAISILNRCGASDMTKRNSTTSF